MDGCDCLKSFSPIVRDWFVKNVGIPSEPQKRGWPEIASGSNVLICAPTGSGKTFAAFLKCLDMIYTHKTPGSRNTGIKIVYISPLKALNNDIYRNLELPINGIRQLASSLGQELPEVEVGIRTGDTPKKDRTRMQKYPPDILITTPESLFIMLTSESYRKLFATVEYLIVDEIHLVCANKRGVHLAVTMERLERLAEKPLKRIGLTATIHPLEEAARFLVGNRSAATTIINCDRKKSIDLTVSLPVKDFKVLPENTVWPAIYSELLALVKSHKSTLIFVNNRSSCDPANPYKDILSSVYPVRLGKQQGTAIVFRNGKPVLVVREYGSTFQRLTDDPDILDKAAACFVDSFQNRRIWTGRKNLFTEYWLEPGKDEERSKIGDSPVYDKLLELGYDRGYSGITLWRKSL